MRRILVTLHYPLDCVCMIAIEREAMALAYGAAKRMGA
jgi:hypothetical protein